MAWTATPALRSRTGINRKGMGRDTPGTTVLVHEWVTGGGLAGSALPASWAAEGRAMRLAIARDFAGVPGVDVVMTRDARLPPDTGPWKVVAIGPGGEERC